MYSSIADMKDKILWLTGRLALSQKVEQLQEQNCVLRDEIELHKSSQKGFESLWMGCKKQVADLEAKNRAQTDAHNAKVIEVGTRIESQTNLNKMKGEEIKELILKNREMSETIKTLRAKNKTLTAKLKALKQC